MDEVEDFEQDSASQQSEALSHGIRVRVQAVYSDEHSQPTQLSWFFLYTVSVSNESDETVQLISRHWVITDATNSVEEVRGLGVVGKQPVLAPGESFEYTSGCPLRTPFGAMQGTYQMVTQDGQRFEVKIARFTLSGPYTVH